MYVQFSIKHRAAYTCYFQGLSVDKLCSHTHRHTDTDTPTHMDMHVQIAFIFYIIHTCIATYVVTVDKNL